MSYPYPGPGGPHQVPNGFVAPPSRGGGLPSWAKVLIAVLVVLVVAAGFLVGRSLLGSRAAAAEVTLMPVNTAGANPFMAPVGTDVAGVRPLADTGGTFAADTPGLYGGSLDNQSCDPDKMVRFLRQNPDMAAAWSGALGIRPVDIPGYVDTLTSVVLRSDTAVTNHGFVDGRAVPFPAVLQAGTAVLVDQYGTPVVQCYCGNPLAAPARIAQPVYVGMRWQSFNITSITMIQQTTVVNNVFNIIDLRTFRPFERDILEETPDVPLDPEGTPNDPNGGGNIGPDNRRFGEPPPPDAECPPGSAPSSASSEQSPAAEASESSSESATATSSPPAAGSASSAQCAPASESSSQTSSSTSSTTSSSTAESQPAG